MKKPSPKKSTNVSASSSSAFPRRTLKKGSSLNESKKSLRKSTAAKSAATQHRLKARTEAERNKPKQPKTEYKILTQEELLAECEETEKENLQSLEKFKMMELEKKRVRPTKGSAYTGPIIRYHSLSMPIVNDEPKLVKEILPVEESSAEEKKRTTRRSRMAANDAVKASERNRCERTFITFNNDIDNKVFDTLFPQQPPRKRKVQAKCMISGNPARYFDPVSQHYYYGRVEFKIIREGYYQMLESKGNLDDPEVAAWIAWRKKMKEQNAKKATKLNE